MVDWKSPTGMANENAIFVKTTFSLFGLYLWELMMTFNFEMSLITGKRKFTWHLIFFFLCRYSILLALMGLLVSFSPVHKINCQALYTFNSFACQMAILNASTSLMIRTVALWQRKFVTIPLVLLSVVHWGVLCRGIFAIEVVWDNAISACSVMKIDHSILEANFFYTMAFDAIILVFTTTALFKYLYFRSSLWNLLFRDGLVYFLITFCCNSVPAVLSILNLNIVMNIIATVPTATISAIAACRLVIRLQDFSQPDLYIHSSQVAIATPFTPARNVVMQQSSRRPEIHVTTDHITMEELTPSIPETTPGKSVYDLESKGAENYFGKSDKDSDSFNTGAA